MSQWRKVKSIRDLYCQLHHNLVLWLGRGLLGQLARCDFTVAFSALPPGKGLRCQESGNQSPTEDADGPSFFDRT